MVFKTFADIEQHLATRGMFHMDLRLERMERVLEALKPRRVPACAQVVGTNGKGSTATFLASLARASGCTVGLFTSPHLANVRERIRLYSPEDGGRLLPEVDWVGPANAVMAAGGDVLTYFEFLTVLAARIFDEAGVDVAIYEAGLGGTHDATTVLDKDVLCITPVELDHEAVLGHTPEAIAHDKAGAMRPGVRVFSALQSQSVASILADTAQRCGAVLSVADEASPGFALGLSGGHQRINAGLAVEAWRYLAGLRGWPVSEHSLASGLASAWLPGRLHRIPGRTGHPELIIDGAHNAHGLRALTRALGTLPEWPECLIFACMADKDLDAIIPLVRSIADGRTVFVPPVADCERAMPPAELARLIGRGARPMPSLPAALQAAESARPALLCGSLYLTGEFYSLWPEYLNAPPR